MGPGAGELPWLDRCPAAGLILIMQVGAYCFEAVVERVEIQANPADDLLCYVRGRYRSLTR